MLERRARTLRIHMPATKILLVGPKQVGKSVIADMLANDAVMSLDLASPYVGTQGCRILEFEAQSGSTPRTASKVGATSVPVELWDCSGDPDFQSCWPAMMHDAAGVVLVYNPVRKRAMLNELSRRNMCCC